MDDNKPSSAELNKALSTADAAASSLAQSTTSPPADIIVTRISRLCKTWYLELQQLTVDAIDVQFNEAQAQCVQSKVGLLQGGITQLCTVVNGGKKTDTLFVVTEGAESSSENGRTRNFSHSRFDQIVEALRTTTISSTASQTASTSSTLVPKLAASHVQQSTHEQEGCSSSSARNNGPNLDDDGRHHSGSGPIGGNEHHIVPQTTRTNPAVAYGPFAPALYGMMPPVRPPMPFNDSWRIQEEIDEAIQCNAVKLRVRNLPPNSHMNDLLNYFSRFGRPQAAQVHNHNVMLARQNHIPHGSFIVSAEAAASPVWGFVVMCTTAELCRVLRYAVKQPHVINGVRVNVTLYRSNDGVVSSGRWAPVQQQRQQPRDRAPPHNTVAAAGVKNNNSNTKSAQPYHHSRMIAERFLAVDNESRADSSAATAATTIGPAVGPPLRILASPVSAVSAASGTVPAQVAVAAASPVISNNTNGTTAAGPPLPIAGSSGDGRKSSSPEADQLLRFLGGSNSNGNAAAAVNVVTTNGAATSAVLNGDYKAAGDAAHSRQHSCENNDKLYSITATNIPYTLSRESVKRMFELNGGELEQLFISEGYNNMNAFNASQPNQNKIKKNGGFAHVKFVDSEVENRLLRCGCILYDKAGLNMEENARIEGTAAAGRGGSPSPVPNLWKIILAPFDPTRSNNFKK